MDMPRPFWKPRERRRNAARFKLAARRQRRQLENSHESGARIFADSFCCMKAARFSLWDLTDHYARTHLRHLEKAWPGKQGNPGHSEVVGHRRREGSLQFAR